MEEKGKKKEGEREVGVNEERTVICDRKIDSEVILLAGHVMMLLYVIYKIKIKV